ncbi:MAG: hypothetical protein HKP61_05960 [Dactylosporangium sp.]|nr:hypothetical protein [Dactylosporangium sp.]NNJ60491.1 hypothetical protein [Dactylosporangium sp.]
MIGRRDAEFPTLGSSALPLLLTAATAPASPDELAGEAAAVEAFRAARLAASGAQPGGHPAGRKDEPTKRPIRGKSNKGVTSNKSHKSGSQGKDCADWRSGPAAPGKKPSTQKTH